MALLREAETTQLPEKLRKGKFRLTPDQVDGLIAAERYNLEAFHNWSTDGDNAASEGEPKNSLLEGGKFPIRVFRSFRSHRREPFSKTTSAENGGVRLVNEHSLRRAPRVVRERDTDAAGNEIVIDESPWSLSELNLKGLPQGISLVPNGSFPLAELGNGAILKLVKVAGEEQPSPEVMELRELAKLIVPESRARSRRAFVELNGHIRSIRDHHYSAADNINWYRRRRNRRSIERWWGVGIRRKEAERAQVRQALKVEATNNYLPAAPENWESHLQINNPVADLTLIPDQYVKTSFSEAEIDELVKDFI